MGKLTVKKLKKILDLNYKEDDIIYYISYKCLEVESETIKISTKSILENTSLFLNSFHFFDNYSDNEIWDISGCCEAENE